MDTTTRFLTIRSIGLTMAMGLLVSLGAAQELLPGFSRAPEFDEQTTSYTVCGDAYVSINAPLKLKEKAPTRLIFYALPNGNTTSMTIGKKTGPKDDWHYNIQHIGAQTRRLRELLPDQNIIVAYLEAGGKSWPAWRKKHTDNAKLIPEIIDGVRSKFAGYNPAVTMSAHSGGGSLIFGFINGFEALPDWLDRIVWLDADYGYADEDHHGDKLLAWLKGSPKRHLCVVAYNDSDITFEGKRVLKNPAGGTWGSTQRMAERFKKDVEVTSVTLTTSPSLIHCTGMGGQIDILLHPNLENKILHTVLVEKNGFIYTMLVGTPEASKSDEFWGEVRYPKYIQNY